MADKKLPGIAAEDIGRCAYGIFKRGTEFQGKTVGIVGEIITGEQMAAARDAGLSRELNPQIQNFAQWLNRHKAQMPIG